MIAPYVLGATLANRVGASWSWPVFWFGLFGSILVQLIAHYSGEIYDLSEDRLSVILEKNSFTGGSCMLVENKIQPQKVKNLIWAVLCGALIIGLILQFYFKTGVWTLFLGISGIFCAYFYSAPPVRLVSRGIGEIFIAYAYGWLALATGFYLQAGYFSGLAIWLALPIAASVANMILINEYPDYPADKLAGKLNLLVRIGKTKAAAVYGWLTIFTGVTFFFAVAKGLPKLSLVIYLPVLTVALILAFRMRQGAYTDRIKLERMCALTILVSLGTSLSCILGLLWSK
jgi:1,4-dihydroxy-2-naphthoate octaprenyltransferase